MRGLAVGVLCAALGSVGAAAQSMDALEEQALAGDYQSQRNLAYCLGTAQCQGILAPRKLDACAWRFVIIGSGVKAVDDSDVLNYRSDCVERLKDDERAVAQRKARALFEQIYKRPMTAKAPETRT